MRLESGDAIERNNIDWIRQNIPLYEEIWSIYIGHNGKGVPLKGFTASQEIRNRGDRASTRLTTLSSYAWCSFVKH